MSYIIGAHPGCISIHGWPAAVIRKKNKIAGKKLKRAVMVLLCLDVKEGLL